MPAKQSPLLADERRREIVKMLKKDGRVAVEDLVRRFKVSAVTIRADLGQLAGHGIMARSYGGAMLPQEPDQEFPLNIRRPYTTPRRFDRPAAAKIVKSHQTVIIDSGTTAAEVARAIKRTNLEALTVITHSLKHRAGIY